MGRARRASRTPLHNANDIVLKSEKRAGERAGGRADGAGGAGSGMGASWPAALEMTRREANGDLGEIGTERAENLREQYDELDQLLTQDLMREPRSASQPGAAGGGRQGPPSSGPSGASGGRGAKSRARTSERDKRSVPFKRLHNLPP